MQAGKMEVATAASSGKSEGKMSPSPAAPPRPRARAVTICVVSLLFAWFAARAVRRSSAFEDEQLVSAVVWALSPPIYAYLFFWTVALSDPTIGVTLCLFARVTFLPLLADAAANLVASPCAGAAAMFLATVYSAVKAGGALSFRRQRAGTELAAVPASSYRSRAEDDHDRTNSGWTLAVVSMVFVVGVLFAAVSLLALSSEPDGAGGEAVLGLLMLAAGPVLLVTRHSQLQLEGSPLQADTGEFVFSLVPAVLGCVVVAVAAGVIAGASAPAVVVVWAGALGMAGFFGYGRALEAQYEQLVAAKRSEPRTAAQDGSGLLVGRDEEDRGRLFSSYRRSCRSLPGLCFAKTVEVHMLKAQNHIC